MLIVGMKVVCIDDKFPLGISKYYTALPKEGETYTIRGISIGISLNGEEGEIAVLLRELINPKSDKGPERAFKESRFRPLEELTEEEILQIGKEKENNLVNVE